MRVMVMVTLAKVLLPSMPTRAQQALACTGGKCTDLPPCSSERLLCKPQNLGKGEIVLDLAADRTNSRIQDENLFAFPTVSGAPHSFVGLNSGVVWVRWRNCLCLTRQLFPPAAHHNDNGITSKCATESTNSINPKSTLNRLQHHLAASSQAPSSPQIMVKIKFSHVKQDSCHAAMAAGS